MSAPARELTHPCRECKSPREARRRVPTSGRERPRVSASPPRAAPHLGADPLAGVERGASARRRRVAHVELALRLHVARRGDDARGGRFDGKGAAARRACAARATTETGRYVQPRRAAARKGRPALVVETASGGTPCAAAGRRSTPCAVHPSATRNASQGDRRLERSRAGLVRRARGSRPRLSGPLRPSPPPRGVVSPHGGRRARQAPKGDLTLRSFPCTSVSGTLRVFCRSAAAHAASRYATRRSASSISRCEASRLRARCALESRGCGLSPGGSEAVR